MPSPRFEHCLQYAAAAAANGNPLFNAAGLRWGAFGVGPNQNLYPWNTMIRLALLDTVAGASITFTLEEAPFPGTAWTAPIGGTGTYTLTIPTGVLMKGHHFLHKARQPCLRVRTSAYTGGSAPKAYAYASPGFYNQ